MIGKRYQTHQIESVFNLLTLQFECHLGRNGRSPVRRRKIDGSARLLALFVESAPQYRPLLSKRWNEVQAFFGEIGVAMERNRCAVISRNWWLIPSARNLRWCQSLASNFSRGSGTYRDLGLTTWRPTRPSDRHFIDCICYSSLFFKPLVYNGRQNENIHNCTRTDQLEFWPWNNNAMGQARKMRKPRNCGLIISAPETVWSRSACLPSTRRMSSISLI